MRRIVIALSISALAFVGATGSADAAAKRYSSCDALLSKYPTGVAKNVAAATASVASGHSRPKVDAALYRENGKRLDRNKDGVMCEQQS